MIGQSSDRICKTQMRRSIVVIPAYKTEVEHIEAISLIRCRERLSDFTICFVAPEGLALDEYYSVVPDARAFFFDKSFFKSVLSYNRLMLSDEFYKCFADYDYMLIYQLDALVLDGNLNEFCSLGYDYIGAPWNRLLGIYSFEGREYCASVGNGGFSLRRVEACRRVLEKHRTIADRWMLNEDVFFSHCGLMYPDDFSVAPIEVAASFSLETDADIFIKLNGGKIPFGCHKWQLYCGGYYSEVFNVLKINLPDRFSFREDDKRFYGNYLYRCALNKLCNEGEMLTRKLPREIYLYGYGNEGERLYKLLIQRKICVLGIYDRERIGESVGSIVVEDIDKREKERGEVLITSEKYETEMCNILEKMGEIRGTSYYTLADLIFSEDEIEILYKTWRFE